MPSSGYDIGSELFVPERGMIIGSGGYEVLVLYATNERITLKYTREDNVVSGYTLHVEGICVAPEPVIAVSILEQQQAKQSSGAARRPGIWQGTNRRNRGIHSGLRLVHGTKIA